MIFSSVANEYTSPQKEVNKKKGHPKAAFCYSGDTQ